MGGPDSSPATNSESTPIRTPTGKEETWRVIRPSGEIRRIRTKRSLVSILLGHNSDAEARLFQIGVRDGWPLRLMWILWYLGAVVGLLAAVDVIPRYFVWGAVLMNPLVIVTFALLCKDLVMEILVELDFYIIQLLQVVTISHAIHSIPHWDQRRYFWFLALPSFVIAPLVDAYPAKYRGSFIQLFFVGMLLILIGWHLRELTKSSFYKFSYKFGDLVTLTLFYIRQVHMAARCENTFVLITSPVITQKENVVIDGTGAGVEVEVHEHLKVMPPRAYTSNFESQAVDEWRRLDSDRCITTRALDPGSVSAEGEQSSADDNDSGDSSSGLSPTVKVPGPPRRTSSQRSQRKGQFESSLRPLPEDEKLQSPRTDSKRSKGSKGSKDSLSRSASAPVEGDRPAAAQPQAGRAVSEDVDVERGRGVGQPDTA